MVVEEISKLEKARQLMDEVHVLMRELSESKLIIAGKEFDLAEWITLSEYAKKHNLTLNRVQQWVNRGVVPAESMVIVPELNYLKLIKDQEYLTRATV